MVEFNCSLFLCFMRFLVPICCTDDGLCNLIRVKSRCRNHLSHLEDRCAWRCSSIVLYAIVASSRRVFGDCCRASLGGTLPAWPTIMLPGSKVTSPRIVLLYLVLEPPLSTDSLSLTKVELTSGWSLETRIRMPEKGEVNRSKSIVPLRIWFSKGSRPLREMS